MKSKLVLLVGLGALTLGVAAPSAMATAPGANLRRPASVVKKNVAAKAASRVPSKAAVLAHAPTGSAK
jgi:hypothetical protein